MLFLYNGKLRNHRPKFLSLDRLYKISLAYPNAKQTSVCMEQASDTVLFNTDEYDCHKWSLTCYVFSQDYINSIHKIGFKRNNVNKIATL